MLKFAFLLIILLFSKIFNIAETILIFFSSSFIKDNLSIDFIGFIFVNIVENERGTTFHTNHINDTNPVSAFITYQKAEDGLPHPSNVKTNKSAFELFDMSYLEKERTFRAIQSQIIKIVNEYNLDRIPDDKEIEKWLNTVAEQKGTKYTKV